MGHPAEEGAAGDGAGADRGMTQGGAAGVYLHIGAAFLSAPLLSLAKSIRRHQFSKGGEAASEPRC
jgi:hypothetical protein